MTVMCEWCRVKPAGDKKRTMQGRTIKVCDTCYRK